MRLTLLRSGIGIAGVFALAFGLSACYPNVPIARFQLINETPYPITFFALADSKGGVVSADNLLAEPLAANAVSDADVDSLGDYWLRAIADVDGMPVEHIRGPVTMAGGTVGWAWAMDGDSVIHGTDLDTLYGQTTLPILVIDTNGKAIPDEPKIAATLHVIDNDTGAANRPTLTGANLTTPIAIERRGFSTQTFPKASWGFEVRDENDADANAVLLGMPSEEDWVLYGPWMDRSLIRNVFGYEVWGALGWYTPRTRFCEVYLRDDPADSLEASYEGLFVLAEKVKRDRDRVNITKLGPDDNAEPEITGGYLMEMRRPDRLDESEVAIEIAEGFVLTPVSPNSNRITSAQVAWFTEHITAFETALFAANFRDPVFGYAPFIDIDSFIDYMLLQELFKNRDAFHSSTFLYKDREDVIHMGPIWDLNIAMGYFSFQGIEGTSGWLLTDYDGPISRSPWTERLLQDPDFAERYAARWTEIRREFLSTAKINNRIDAIVAQLDTAQARQFIRWPSLGMTLLPDINFLMFIGPHPDSYQGEILFLKNWLQDRAGWMDAHMPGLLE
ncbi:MAG: CotH kinase family protein [Candidatus Hydrogenedentes bacterium]|nr:CotH kinase family protein [Candidatus Hydrogenedentota bacterium]